MNDNESFRRTRDAIETGLREGLHLGAQLYVSRDGEVLIDASFGESRPGLAMKPDTLTLWFSAGKPLTAVAVAQLVERGRLTWDTPIADVIPEFSAHGKKGISVRHVITHTAGLHVADRIEALPWAETLGRICDARLPNDWVPGQRAASSASAGWFVLGEIVARIAREPVARVVLEQIARPCGLSETRLCFDESEFEERRDRAGFVYDTSGPAPKALDLWNSEEGLKRCIPGASARGPVRELGMFYETLLGLRSRVQSHTEADGSQLSTSNPQQILFAEAIRIMTSRQRTGLFDETFQFQLDCGFGFILNSNRAGLQMPYGYGRNASRETFGHSGNQSSCAFADPKHRLVVAWACNGMPGERKHQHRQRAINNAIHEDVMEMGMKHG